MIRVQVWKRRWWTEDKDLGWQTFAVLPRIGEAILLNNACDAYVVRDIRHHPSDPCVNAFVCIYV